MTSIGVTSIRDVRDQGKLPGPCNGDLQRALVLGAGSRDPARLDLAALGNERRQQAHVLVVDVVDLLRAELADAAPAEEPAARASLALALVVLLAAAAAPATTFFAHRPSAPSMFMSSASSLSRSPRRSLGCGSGGSPRA